MEGEDRNVPYVERRTDNRTRQRIVDLEDRYAKVARSLTIAVAIIGVTLIALTAVSASLINANQDRSKQIQGERAKTTRDNCNAQNVRHNSATQALNDSFEGGENRETTATQRRTIMQLIDALAPVRDCEQVVAKAVKSVQ